MCEVLPALLNVIEAMYWIVSLTQFKCQTLGCRTDVERGEKGKAT